MKNIFLLILAVLFLASVAWSQYSGQLAPAITVSKGEAQGGIYTAIYDGAFGISGQYRYGIGGYTDIGAKLGFIDLDDNKDRGGAGLIASLDTKYQIMELRIQDPIDMSLGADFEFILAEHIDIISLGGFVVGSYPLKLRSDRAVVPYGRLILRVERNDHDPGDVDRDFDIGLNFGSTLELSTRSRALAELQFDDRFGFFMGLEFGL